MPPRKPDNFHRFIRDILLQQAQLVAEMQASTDFDQNFLVLLEKHAVNISSFAEITQINPETRIAVICPRETDVSAAVTKELLVQLKEAVCLEALEFQLLNNEACDFVLDFIEKHPEELPTMITFNCQQVDSKRLQRLFNACGKFTECKGLTLALNACQLSPAAQDAFDDMLKENKSIETFSLENRKTKMIILSDDFEANFRKNNPKRIMSYVCDELYQLQGPAILEVFLDKLRTNLFLVELRYSCNPTHFEPRIPDRVVILNNNINACLRRNHLLMHYPQHSTAIKRFSKQQGLYELDSIPSLQFFALSEVLKTTGMEQLPEHIRTHLLEAESCEEIMTAAKAGK